MGNTAKLGAFLTLYLGVTQHDNMGFVRCSCTHVVLTTRPAHTELTGSVLQHGNWIGRKPRVCCAPLLSRRHNGMLMWKTLSSAHTLQQRERNSCQRTTLVSRPITRAFLPFLASCRFAEEGDGLRSAKQSQPWRKPGGTFWLCSLPRRRRLQVRTSRPLPRPVRGVV